MSFGITELIIILVIVLLLFGTKKTQKYRDRFRWRHQRI